jgi:hypothetical protein
MPPRPHWRSVSPVWQVPNESQQPLQLALVQGVHL